MKQLIKKLATVITLAITPHALAVVAGSDNSVSIQSHTIFPAADADNAMNGFGWFKNGFTLENSATSCLFNSVYPISGTINMNGGTLTLAQDLVFKDAVFIASLGTFIGNNNNIDFTKGIYSGSTPPDATFQDANLYSSSDFIVSSNFTFTGNCLIDGGGLNINLLPSLGNFIIQSNSSLTLRNLSLKGLEGTNIRCVDDTGVLILNNVSIELSDAFSFSRGSMLFSNYVDFQGGNTFTYDTSQTSTIATDTILKFLEKTTLVLGRSTDSTSIEPLNFTDQSSVLNLDAANLIINSHGARFLRGTFQVSNNVVVDALGSSTATALEFGDGTQANDFYFMFDSGSLYEPGGFQVLNDFQPNILLSKVGGAIIASSAGSTIYINQNQTITNLTSQANASAQTIIAPGKTLSFNNLIVITQLGNFTITGIFVDALTNLLAGEQSIILTGGLPLVTLVANAGNMISGTGFVLAPIILQDSNAQLIWTAQALVDANITLNGGTLTLLNDLTLGNGSSILGQGIVQVDSKNLNFGQTDLSFTDTLYFDSAIGGKINLNSDVVLSGRWTFSGHCTLDCMGHNLDISQGEIVIEQGSSLSLESATLKGLSGSNIRCLDSASLLRFENDLLIQDAAFTFTQGSIELNTQVTFRGDSVFAYQSTNTMIINDNTIVLMDNGFTFSYDPGTYPDLIQFADKTSQLFLNQSTLHATAQGLQLTKGTMLVNALATLESEIVNGVDNGITLGDCFDSTNDFAVNLASCVNLTVASGSLNYKNVLTNSWLIVNNLTFADNTSLNVYQTLTNGTAITTFGLNCFLRTAPGQTLNGPVSGSPTQELNVLSC